jgi:hypothetical protein
MFRRSSSRVTTHIRRPPVSASFVISSCSTILIYYSRASMTPVPWRNAVLARTNGRSFKRQAAFILSADRPHSGNSASGRSSPFPTRKLWHDKLLVADAYSSRRTRSSVPPCRSGALWNSSASASCDRLWRAHGSAEPRRNARLGTGAPMHSHLPLRVPSRVDWKQIFDLPNSSSRQRLLFLKTKGLRLSGWDVANSHRGCPHCATAGHVGGSTIRIVWGCPAV